MPSLYAGVIVEQSHPTLDRIFHYSVPAELEECIKPGIRVCVPFGASNKPTIGYILEIDSETSISPDKIKPIKEVLETYPLLLPKLIPIVHWMKKEYHCLTIEAIHCFVPKLSKSMAVKSDFKDDNEKVLTSESDIKLTDEQRSAVELMGEALLKDSGNFILEGVTGSGKTEVYIRLAQKASETGKQTIILVPEISLTPQTVERFKSRFGQMVSILHSRLSSAERLKHWHNIRTGLTKIVVGARSAVFAPINHLGLIVIDEAHEDSYKSDQRPRYHAIDVARKRCEIEGGVLILGSATPRVEDSYSEGKLYKRIEITQRVEQRPMPPVKIVDMREEITKGNRSIFSKPLYIALKQVLTRGEQAILLINRRGYAQSVLCRACGLVVMCQNCQISLTYHSEENILKCHYCALKKPYPTVCPKCKSKYIKNFGLGTQKVQEELTRFFPDAKTVRMDMDTTAKKDSHQTMLDAFRKGEYDFLLGTQMIAKGLDFPNVTLVGVVTADTSLNLPDYRNGEKTFQLIAQVAGRTGRSAKGGEVIVQTYQPNHYAIEYASRHDYRSFYKKEIEMRRILRYPPFTHIVRILLTGEQEVLLSTLSNRVAKCLRSKTSQDPLLKASVLDIGVCPAPLEKINGKYRWQILIRLKHADKVLDMFHAVVDECCTNLPVTEERIIIDFYPVSLL